MTPSGTLRTIVIEPGINEEELMSALLIGYARISTDEQDLTAQHDALTALGVSAERPTSITA